MSLEVRGGEIFGFLGPNGAGKTTTIKLAVGLLVPDRGKVIVNGRDVAVEPVAAKTQIGYVPDNPDVYDRLTGMEYLNLVADVFRVSRTERKRRIEEVAERLCDRVGIIHRGRLIACGTVDELRERRQREHESLEDIFLELTQAGEGE